MRIPNRRHKPGPYQLVQEAERLHTKLLKHNEAQDGKLQDLVERSRARYLRRAKRLTQTSMWHRMIAYRHKARQRSQPPSNTP